MITVVLLVILGIGAIIDFNIPFAAANFALAAWIVFCDNPFQPKKARPIPAGTQHTCIRSNAPGRSCLDCRFCNTARAKGERIFCTWDSEHYYPETGRTCNDFKR